jgi:hypothetical protein
MFLVERVVEAVEAIFSDVNHPGFRVRASKLGKCGQGREADFDIGLVSGGIGKWVREGEVRHHVISWLMGP